MGEIRFVGTGETRGYLYPVCKKKLVFLSTCKMVGKYGGVLKHLIAMV